MTPRGWKPLSVAKSTFFHARVVRVSRSPDLNEQMSCRIILDPQSGWSMDSKGLLMHTISVVPDFALAFLA